MARKSDQRRPIPSPLDLGTGECRYRDTCERYAPAEPRRICAKPDRLKLVKVTWPLCFRRHGAEGGAVEVPDTVPVDEGLEGELVYG